MFGIKRKKLKKKAKGSAALNIVRSECQHIGIREAQEDTYAISEIKTGSAGKGVVAVLADGMGGLNLGEEASRVAVKTILKNYNSNVAINSVPDSMFISLLIANTAVFDLAYKDGKDYEMGTTLVAAATSDDGWCYWVSAGDSRIYHFKDGYLFRLTTDHTYAKYLDEELKNQNITEDEAYNHPERCSLTSYLGLEELPEVDRNTEPLKLKHGDKVLLCSDGLYDSLSEIEIEAILCENYDNIAERLVSTALSQENPYQDNVTVLVLSCEQ